MIPWGILVIEVVVLSLTSKYLFSGLFVIFQTVTGSKKIATFVIALIFFPGVVVHELSHLVIAELLFVKTRNMEFKPVMTEGGLKLGSVQVARSDIIRQLLIGFAPVIVGGGFLIGLLWGLSSLFSYKDIFSSPVSFGLSLLGAFGVFVITNTMFSSKKDLEGLLGFIVFAFIIVGGLYFAGVRVHELIGLVIFDERVIAVVEQAVILLLIPVGINLFVLSATASVLKRRGLKLSH